MSTFVMPITPGPEHFAFTHDIRGVLFRFVFHFNRRDQHWFMGIYNPDTLEPIRVGIKVVVDYSLLGSLQNTGRPSAIFIALDTESTGLDPETVDALGERVKILFQEMVREFPG